MSKYIIEIKHNKDTIIDNVFGGKRYIYRYRSNYEYVETCFKRCEAKTFATKSAAEKAAIRLVEIYEHFKGYEIIEIKKKI